MCDVPDFLQQLPSAVHLGIFGTLCLLRLYSTVHTLAALPTSSRKNLFGSVCIWSELEKLYTSNYIQVYLGLTEVGLDLFRRAFRKSVASDEALSLICGGLTPSPLTLF